MEKFPVSPKYMIHSIWRHRDLIAISSRREILGRYRGSVMGFMWSFINPIVMLLIYTFVFSVVFKARWGSGGESNAEFAMLLFAGLMVFNIFGECINRAPLLIVSNVNYVKKVLFPLEILPVVALISAVCHGLISFFVWLVAYFFLFGFPYLTIFYLPLILLPLVLLIVGFSWFFASLGVYFKDVNQLISILTTIVMFLCPIFYPMTAVPEQYRAILYCNPLTFVVEQIRNVLYFGLHPNFAALMFLGFVTTVFAWLGFFWFQKTRKGFADVL